MLKLEVIGNLGADAKVNEGNFRKFVSFNVAHTEKFQDKGGVSHEITTWVNCIINWDCVNILPYLKKGAKVFCRGNVRLRTFVNHNKETMAGVDCIVSDIELCGGIRPDTATNQTEQVKPENPFTPNEQDAKPF